MKNALKIIELFVGIKRREKEVAKEVRDLKEHFYAACNEVSDGSTQVEVAGALIVKKVTNEYAWPARISRLEAELKVAKEAFKKTAKPVGHSVVWAVEV